MKILLVEDEDDLSGLLSKGLRKSGYAVDVAFDGEEAWYLYEVNEYDLIVLDLNIPKIDGIDVLKKIRKADFSTKILILSARSKVEERVQGLDCGANDYLIKPFDFIELEARIRTLLRMAFVQQSSILACGKLKMDTVRKKVLLEEKSLMLTKKEYAISEYLFLNKGAVISAETLIEHIWDSEADLFSNSLKYHVHSIKKKIEKAGGDKEYIRNLRGQGYMLSGGKDENY